MMRTTECESTPAMIDFGRTRRACAAGAASAAPLEMPRFSQNCATAPASQSEPSLAQAPIWLAALLNSDCRAMSGGLDRSIRWKCVSGVALLYTNGGSATERIEPLGGTLLPGETLVVYWAPGECEYTLEVFGRGRRGPHERDRNRHL